MTACDPKETFIKSNHFDLILTISGLGCWVAFLLSLNFGSFDLFAVSTETSNALLLVAVLLALVALILLTRHLISSELLSLPIISGFLGSTLLATIFILAILRYVRVEG
jgi:hypothetical protein